MAAVDFGNVKTDAGLAKVNDHMAKQSYVVGCCPTQQDVTTFSKMLGCPPCSKFPHAARWHRHIASFSVAERDSWPGQKASAAKKEEDEDFDLFGEETAEEAATKQAMKAAPKKDEKKKKVVINKSTLVIDIKPQSLDIDLGKVEKAVRAIAMDGVDWAQCSKKVPIAFGLSKLQMGCTIIDDLVATDDIIERIEELGLTEEQVKEYQKKRDAGDDDEEYDEDEEVPGWVQSAEIVSFQKL